MAVPISSAVPTKPTVVRGKAKAKATPTPLRPSAPVPYSASAVPELADEATSMEAHVATIARIPLLDVTEERALAAHMRRGGRAGEKARAQLFHSNLRWAYTLARHWFRSVLEEDRMDMVQMANVSLWRHLPMVDPALGLVTTYVTAPIVRDLSRFVDECTDRGVHRTSREHLLDRKIRRLLTAYEAAEATQDAPRCRRISEELSRACGVALFQDAGAREDTSGQAEAIAEVVSRFAALPISSLSDEATPGRGQSDTFAIADTIPDERADADPVAAAVKAVDGPAKAAQVAAFVANAVTPREAQILALFYGDGPEAGNMSAIGRLLGLHRERIRQIRNDALRKLRQADRTAGVLRSLLD